MRLQVLAGLPVRVLVNFPIVCIYICVIYDTYVPQAFWFRASVFGMWTKNNLSLGRTKIWIQIQIFNDIFGVIRLFETKLNLNSKFEFSNCHFFFDKFMT